MSEMKRPANERWLNQEETSNYEEHLADFLTRTPSDGEHESNEDRFKEMYVIMFTNARGLVNIDRLFNPFLVYLLKNTDLGDHLKVCKDFPFNEKEKFREKAKELARLIIAEVIAEGCQE